MAAHSSSQSGRRWLWPADDKGGVESLSARWESNGWTVEGTVEDLTATYVVRLAEDFSVRQFLLFRDMDEPDLWLAHDGHGNWGEVNGAVRTDLSGCRHVGLAGCRATMLTPLLACALGTPSADPVLTLVAVVDVETLHVEPMPYCARQAGVPDRWTVDLNDIAGEVDLAGI